MTMAPGSPDSVTKGERDLGTVPSCENYEADPQMSLAAWARRGSQWGLVLGVGRC